MPIPLVVGTIASSIIGSSTSKTEHMIKIAAAIDVSVNEWLRSSCTVQGTGAGIVASGQGAGVLTVLPNPAFMESAFKANGIVGLLASSLWSPVVFGVSGVYALQGPSAIVGLGLFSGGFVGDVNVLISGLIRNFKTQGIIGINATNLCTALGQGIYAHFQSGFVVGVIVGGVSLAVSTGPIVCTFS
jgi:hypothetical protein